MILSFFRETLTNPSFVRPRLIAYDFGRVMLSDAPPNTGWIFRYQYSLPSFSLISFSWSTPISLIFVIFIISYIKENDKIDIKYDNSCHSMTIDHISRLVSYNKDLATRHKQSVLYAVGKLGNPLPKEVKKLLDEGVENDFNTNRYEKGHITEEELEKEVNEAKLNLRTVMRKLAELTKEGLLEHQNNRYSVSKKAQSDIRYYAQLFGLEALTRLMGAHYPELRPLKKNIDELVKIFGTYIVFCFIEGCSPYT